MTIREVFHGAGADLRYAVRGLTRTPGFTAVAVLALALGIGANVTVFTLANAFLFKNLPFDNSDRIIYVSSTNTSRPGSARGMSHPDFVDYSDQARSFEGSAAFTSGSVDVSDGIALPERYRCAYLTSAALSGHRPEATARARLPARRRDTGRRAGHDAELRSSGRAVIRARTRSSGGPFASTIVPPR